MDAPVDKTEVLDQLAVHPHKFSLFAALRLLEQLYAAQPRLGESRKASDDPVRLGHAPHLTFAPSDVASYDAQAPGGRPRLEQYSFGLFGPNGPLPLHLTEYAYERRRHQDDATFVDFLNVFHHRLIALFYRAWANSDPATSFDRPQSDRFVMYLGALIGLAPEDARNRDAVLDYAKLSRVGLLGPQARSAEGLERLLSDYFGQPVEVRSFSGAWLPIPPELYCRLGKEKDLARLGQSATIGRSTWQCQHKFEIVIGPLTLEAFRNFLPGARGLAELHALVRLYTNDEWTWQVRLLLRDAEIPGVRLGESAQLGWTSWLGRRRATGDEVLIQEERAAAASAPPSKRAALQAA
ncbi:MAG TPA: type VI secretion system baseplate subunit TssG [Steroidobacteraceae bacterium]